MAAPLPPLITLEEHFFSAASIASAPESAPYSEQLKHIPGLMDKLTDLDTLRLQSMDENSISLQVISHGPTAPLLSPTDCHAANLQLHEACVAHPTRFAGFATLPMGDPDAAAKELAFCIEELGFVGALIDSHTDDGTTYEGPTYRGFWYTVQSLGVPVYIHPTWTTDAMRSAIFPNATSTTTSNSGGSGAMGKSAMDSMLASSWNWHSEVALHVFKLFAAGVFDRFPRLKIVVGHFGEMIPFMLERLVQLSPRWGERQRDFKTVYDENLWLTTSGVWSLAPLRCMLANTRMDRILFSVDYPFARNEWGKKWIEELRESGLVSEEGLQMIAYKNAEKLLGLRVKVGDEGEEKQEEEEQER